MSSAHIRTVSYLERELDKGGGLDIHKKSVKAAIESEDGSIIEAEFGMTFLQLYILKKWLLDNGCRRVIVESTASYWYRIDQVLRDEINVIVVNPRDVKSSSWKKTDKIQLNDTQVFLIGKALSTMDHIQKTIDEIDAILYTKAESHKEDLQILMSVPGVKFIAAITVLAEIGNYRDFKDGDQMACYSGLTPTVDSSGEKNTLGKITKHGSRHLRWVLNQVAHGASKTKKSRMSQVYLRLLRRKGKPKAITALARKIISIMHHLLINREMWKEEGFKKRRLDFDFDRTSSSSQLTWVDLLFNNVVRTGKGKPGGGG